MPRPWQAMDLASAEDGHNPTEHAISFISPSAHTQNGYTTTKRVAKAAVIMDLLRLHAI